MWRSKHVRIKRSVKGTETRVVSVLKDKRRIYTAKAKVKVKVG